MGKKKAKKTDSANGLIAAAADGVTHLMELIDLYADGERRRYVAFLHDAHSRNPDGMEEWIGKNVATLASLGVTPEQIRSGNAD